MKSEQMTWVRPQWRWIKKYKGKMYSVSCNQLGTEKTKDASRVAANNWWTHRKATLDDHAQAAKPRRAAYEAVIEKFDAMASWEDKHGTKSNASGYRAEAKELSDTLERSDEPPILEWHQQPLAGISEAGKWIWQDRLARTEDASDGDRIGQHLDEFLASKLSEVKINISAGRYDNLRRSIETLRDWIGASTPLSQVNGQTLVSYRSFLLKEAKERELKMSWARDHQSVFKQFLLDCWEREKIASLPRNFYSKKLAIEVPDTEIVYWEKHEIEVYIAHSCDRVRLFLLLMLNCGMYQGDIADICEDEVDWKQGRIVRWRSKTKKKGRKVDYPLWPCTFQLLRQFRSGDTEHVLLSEGGTHLNLSDINPDGKRKRDDKIRTAVEKVEEHCGVVLKPLKSLRKTGANMIAEKYGDGVSDHYLAHRLRTVASKHYVTPTKEKFDEAVTWLRTQFGFE